MQQTESEQGTKKPFATAQNERPSKQKESNDVYYRPKPGGIKATEMNRRIHVTKVPTTPASKAFIKLFPFNGRQDKETRVYSKEYLLSLFDPGSKPPPDANIIDSIFISQPNPNPSKIIQDHLKAIAEKPELGQIHSENVNHLETTSSSPTRVKRVDLWDTPSGVGAFNHEGFFSNTSATEMIPGLTEPLFNAHVAPQPKIEKPIASSHPLLNLPPLESFAKETPDHRPFDPFTSKFNAISLDSHTQQNRYHSLPQQFQNQPAPQHIPLLAQFHHSPQNVSSHDPRGGILLEFPNSIHSVRPISFESTQFQQQSSNVPNRIPPFIPPQWLYRDLSGIIQGPFNSIDMQEWMDGGFFPDTLAIKHLNDPSFITVYQFKMIFGPTQPFIRELKELEAKYHLALQTTHKFLGQSAAVHVQQHPQHKQPSPPQHDGFSRLQMSEQRPKTPVQKDHSRQASGFLQSVEPPIQLIKESIPLVESKVSLYSNASSTTQNTAVFSTTTHAFSPTITKIKSPVQSLSLSPVAITMSKPASPVKKENVMAIQVTPVSVSKPAAWQKVDLAQKENKIVFQERMEQDEFIMKQKTAMIDHQKSELLLMEAQKLEKIARQVSHPQTQVGNPWGKPTEARKSLVDIMQEEKVMGVQPKENVTAYASTGWVNVAKSGASLNPTTETFVSKTTQSNTKGKAGLKGVPMSETRDKLNHTVPSSSVQTQWTDSPHITFVKEWAAKALLPASKTVSGTLHFNPLFIAIAEDFITILFELPVNDSQTLYQICDDTLMGITAINPRKFAEEFSRLRKQGESQKSGPSSGGYAQQNGLSMFDTGNRFVTVGGKKKKRGKK